MRNYKLYYSLVGIIIILLVSSLPVLAVEKLVIKPVKEELQPRERVKVRVTAVDKKGELINEDVQLLVGVSQGGVANPRTLQQGLTLSEGSGEFTYIAPSNPGTARILLIDKATNISAKHTFQIVKQHRETDWQQESAEITDIQGRVAIKKQATVNWDAALAGVTLHPGDSIKTWGDSWVTLQLFDGSQVTLEPWTTIYIKSLRRAEDNKQLKQSVLKVITGNILCNAQKYLAPGAKFEVETESAAAGIRGTDFEFALEVTGQQEVIVYEGEVVFEYFPEGLVFPIKAGEKLLLAAGKFKMPKIDVHQVTPKEKIKELKQKQEQAKEQEEAKQKEEKKPTEPKEQEKPNKKLVETGQGPDKKSEGQQQKKSSVSLSNLEIGSSQVAEKMYLTLSWQPEFERILGSNLSLGLDLKFYQDPETSSIGLGPTAEDIKIGNLINWIEYDGTYTYLYYGLLEDITYGQSLLMANYEKEKTKGTQLGLSNLTAANLGFRVLLPTDVKSIYPWKTRQTATLYAVRGMSNFKWLVPWQAGINYVVDTSQELTDLSYQVPTTGVSADLSIPVTKLAQPYIEVAKLKDFGLGAEAGVKGELLSNFWYQTGTRVVGENFVPNYFGDDYEYLKDNTLTETESVGRNLPNLSNSNDYPATTGVYIEGGVDLGLAKLNLGYEDYTKQSEYAPILTSRGEGAIPQIEVLPIPAVKGGYNYRQIKFNDYDQGVNSLLNKNTRFSWYVKYPIKAGVFVTLTNKFIPSDDEIAYSREFKLSFSF